MKINGIPLWLKVSERIDYTLFVLNSIKKEIDKRTLMDVLVDRGTGYEDKLLKTINFHGRYLARLKKLYDKLINEAQS